MKVWINGIVDLEGALVGRAIGLPDDFYGSALRRLARASKSAPQARRLPALAQIYEGGSRSEAARVGGVTLQIVPDWVIRFNARGPDGPLDSKAPGKRSILNDVQHRALVETVERGLLPAIHGVVRWRLIDLAHWIPTLNVIELHDVPNQLRPHRWNVADHRGEGLRVTLFIFAISRH